MNKLIFLLSLIIMSGLVMAIPMVPLPVDGSINQAIGGLEISVNCDGVIKTTTTDDNGRFHFDTWTYDLNEWMKEYTLCEASITNNGITRVSDSMFDGISVLFSPINVDNMGLTVSEDDYTAPIMALLVIAVGGIFISKSKTGKITITKIKDFLPKSTGIKIYKSRDGTKDILLHKHRGIRSYHNPTTNHKNPEYRHEDNEFPK